MGQATSSHFDKTISVDTDGLQIFEDRIEIMIGDGRLPHHPTSCYVDIINRKTDRYPEIGAVIYEVMILDLVIELVKIRDVDNVKLSLKSSRPYLQSCSNGPARLE
ncbi:hypothetical protein G5I_14419 [Acromyrmex echinatior]|uniref:Uncharacterized protein n=1 Tax=Acromyrmex echinatior TaxID=103372 RepID=F4X7N5_ACREC|nr:hypothetical protein G5I_14419 [Acromyrmex echinatior]